MADYTGNSIVDYLSSTGQDSSYAARAKMAAERGINNYSGTAAQNTQMLGGLRDNTAPTMPATESVTGTMADKLTPEMKQQMVDVATKHGLPTETEAEQWKIAQAALSPEQLTALGVDINDLVSSREKMNEQEQIYDETDAPSTTGLGVLQSALTAKTDEFNREATTPDMMAAAGITGYGALQSTMAARQKELDTRITGLQDRLLEEGDRATDVYNLALDKYEILRDDYNTEADRMTKTVQDIIDHEQAIDLYEQQAAIDAKYKELENKSGGFGDDYSSSYGGGDWDMPGLEVASQGLIPNDASTYRGPGEWECGEGYNDLTDGEKVGDTWQSKLDVTTHTDNPLVGNGLAIPYGGRVNGHMATVLFFDKDTGTVYTVEFNRDGNGKQTFQQYTIDELNDKYGDSWGFTDSTLKSQYVQYADAIQQDMKSDNEFVKSLIKQYKDGVSVSALGTQISNKFPDTATAKYYKTMLDELILVPEIIDNEAPPGLVGKLIEQYAPGKFDYGTTEGPSPYDQVQDGDKNQTTEEKVAEYLKTLKK